MSKQPHCLISLSALWGWGQALIRAEDAVSWLLSWRAVNGELSENDKWVHILISNTAYNLAQHLAPLLRFSGNKSCNLGTTWNTVNTRLFQGRNKHSTKVDTKMFVVFFWIYIYLSAKKGCHPEVKDRCQLTLTMKFHQITSGFNIVSESES